AVERIDPVATPAASVTCAGCVSEWPSPLASSATVSPGIGFENASSAVTVIVDDATPSAWIVGVESCTVDTVGESDAGPTVIVAGTATAASPAVAVTVFTSARVDASAPVATPSAFVGPDGCVSVLPVPSTASVTCTPSIGLPSASRTVTAIADEPAPATSV